MEEKSQTAKLLRSSKAEIMKVWEARVREALPAAQHESRASLRDSIPDFLEDLLIALETNLSTAKPEIIRFAHKHGSERANTSSYSIEDALTEYNILRRVIFAIIEVQGPIPPRDRDIILEAINYGLAKAGAEYAKLQLSQLAEKNEKLSELHADLKKSEETLKLAVTSSELGIWNLDLSTNLVTWNGTAAELFGFDPATTSLPFEAVESRIYPEDVEKNQNAFKHILSGNDVHFQDFRIVHPSGRVRWLSGSGKLVRDDAGRPARIIGTDRDITESKEVEAALRESEANFKQMANSVPQLVWAATPAGQVDYYNDKMTEYEGAEIVDGEWRWTTLSIQRTKRGP